MQELHCGCCIAGAGPAGLVLGYLLARAGIEVVVLEKHADFLRDFRGDTIHPSTLELLHELGLLEGFLQLPHDKMPQIELVFEDARLMGPDFSNLPTRCKFIAFMPQWDFLNFIAAYARKLPNFKLLMQAEVDGLIESDGRVAGVRATTPAGPLQVHAPLCIAADGRASALRSLAGLRPRDLGAPIDVLWLRVRKLGAVAREALMHVRRGQLLIAIDRGDYWQCALVIRKGGYEAVQAAGIAALRERIADTLPATRAGIEELSDFEHVFLLRVQINRLQRWYRDGLLCIGDAAHAMSPAGGVGINLAIQDAVAAANLLTPSLRSGRVDTQALVAVQRRREWPTRMTQRIQLIAHSRILRVGRDGETIRPPKPAVFLIRMFAPLLRRLGARVIGLGFRPEHIQSSWSAAIRRAPEESTQSR